MLVDLTDEFFDALFFCRHRLDDRRAPRAGIGMPSAETEHVPQVPHGRIRAVTVGLVDHEDVRDLQNPGLCRLDAVTHAGREQHERRIGGGGDLDLGLTNADRLDENHVEAGAIEHPKCLRSRP